MSPAALLTLALACAPDIDPDTTLRVVQHESQSNEFAIGVAQRHGPSLRLSRPPKTKAQAVATAKALLALGKPIDLGLAQISSANLQRLGMSVEDAFDGCSNLSAMQTILRADYQRFAARLGPGQHALIAALSSYNTGTSDRGIRNGYVSAVAQRPGLSVIREHPVPPGRARNP